MTNVYAFQQLKPCVDPGTHKFTVAYPPVGQFGRTQVVCERCGMTREAAKLDRP